MTTDEETWHVCQTQVSSVGAVLKKYALLEVAGGKIEDLNKELRSKYSIDLNAPAHEIVYCGAMRHSLQDEPVAPPTSRPHVPPLRLHETSQANSFSGPTSGRAARGLPDSDVRLPSAWAAYRATPPKHPPIARPTDFVGYVRAETNRQSGHGHVAPVLHGMSFIDSIIDNSQDSQDPASYLEQGYSSKASMPSKGRAASVPNIGYDIEASEAVTAVHVRQVCAQTCGCPYCL